MANLRPHAEATENCVQHRSTSLGGAFNRPLTAHPIDPIECHHRAMELGELAANGAIEKSVLDYMIEVYLKAAQRAGYTGDMGGLSTRLNWTLRDAKNAKERRLRETEQAVKRAAINAIRRRLPMVSIIAAAVHENHYATDRIQDCAAELLAETEIAIERRREDPLEGWWAACAVVEASADDN